MGYVGKQYKITIVDYVIGDNQIGDNVMGDSLLGDGRHYSKQSNKHRNVMI